MMKKKTQPEIIVIGSPNGSGKTTIAREILAERDLLYISADDIAYQISPDNPEKVKVEAGKIFFVRLADAVELKHDILIESTLAGKSLVSWLEKLKGVFNYRVSIVFIFLTNPEICS